MSHGAVGDTHLSWACSPACRDPSEPALHPAPAVLGARGGAAQAGEQSSPWSPAPGAVSGRAAPASSVRAKLPPPEAGPCPGAPGLSEPSKLRRAQTRRGGAGRCRTHREALSPEEMEPGGHPTPGPSAATKLQEDGRPTSGGWAWLGALSSHRSPGCAHPSLLGGPLWEGSGVSQRRRRRKKAGGGRCGPEAALRAARAPGGATRGRTPEAVCLPDPGLWPLGGCRRANRRRGCWVPTGRP